MDVSRNLVPMLAMAAGLAVGWAFGPFGRGVAPEVVVPERADCPATAADAELEKLEVDVELLRAELEEGW